MRACSCYSCRSFVDEGIDGHRFQARRLPRRPGKRSGDLSRLPIVKERALSIREQENLVNLLVAALERQEREEAEARKDGKITGGVWGCLSGSGGLRFQAAEVRRR
jgi:hypothetical protein